MSTLKIQGVKNLNDYNELYRMFFPDNPGESDTNDLTLDLPNELLHPTEQKDQIKRILYEELSGRTGKSLLWGTLTGVKPLKLYSKLLDNNDEDMTRVAGILKEDYLVSDQKISLLERIWQVQKDTLERPGDNHVSVYIGIPFCPTRCTYCSFTSNQKDYGEIIRYLAALKKEIAYVADRMTKHNMVAETVYIGGGTPTTLETAELEDLIVDSVDKIPTIPNFEFTVEAGRPDTITFDKLTKLKELGVNRISINPQTMKAETLEIIGRKHSIDEVVEAFDVAKNVGFRAINTDLIAGLPGETEEDFAETLSRIYKYKPENITVHTLALKNASRMKEDTISGCKNVCDGEAPKTSKMVDFANSFLEEKSYRPYYIYRQKYMADNLENVGYAIPGAECIYNIRIMEEKQTIIAMGAGASSKVYFPKQDRLERVMNVSNYEIYIDRIDEMIDRKKNKLFKSI